MTNNIFITKKSFDNGKQSNVKSLSNVLFMKPGVRVNLMKTYWFEREVCKFQVSGLNFFD